MLENTCERRYSCVSIDVEEKLSSSSSIKSHSSPSEKKIFSAPAGVVPYHVKWSRIRKKTGGQRLIFVWPRKNISHGSFLCSLLPLVRRILVGLVYLGAIHIWPGEFLPTSVPLRAPLPKLPVKCTVIEPLWQDDDKTWTNTLPP